MIEDLFHVLWYSLLQVLISELFEVLISLLELGVLVLPLGIEGQSLFLATNLELAAVFLLGFFQ
jgi:hypothetical protein